MERDNQTMVKFFVLKGISDVPELQAPIFILILLIYLITISDNTTVLLLIYMDPQLHTPMYFFLGNLSLMDMCSITVTQHKVLSNFLLNDNTIPFHACMAQMCVFASLTGADTFILTAMSYDRYVAICRPLQYPMIMNKIVYVLLSFLSWIFGFIDSFVVLLFFLRISCYRSNIINHFFCDLVPLMELSCSNITSLKSLIFIEGLIITLTLFSLTLSSYIYIISAILRIRSSTGRLKAFYTCSSHLTVISLLYVSFLFVYYSPTSTDSLVLKKLSSLFNTAVVPLLNPLIYSLKNKDIKSAFKRKLMHYNKSVYGDHFCCIKKRTL